MRLRCLSLACCFLCLECGLFPSLDSLSRNVGESASGSGGGGRAPVDAGDAGDAGGDGGVCPSAVGPGMKLFSFTQPDGGVVRVCVDETEVTVSQYGAFIAVKGGDMSGQDSRCSMNKSFGSAEDPQSCHPPSMMTSPALPMTCIDWCDALAYCKWAGKRLCGSVGGGTLNASTTSIEEGEWFKACSSNNPTFYVYPYGTSYMPGDCNGADYEAGAPLAPGTLPQCKTPAGILDLSGNVSEFVDVMTSGMYGHWIGGSFDSGAANLECAWNDHDFTTRGFADVGFRCCADP